MLAHQDQSHPTHTPHFPSGVLTLHLEHCLAEIKHDCPCSSAEAHLNALQEEVAALMKEWGFKDAATAEAALRSRQRSLAPHHAGALRRRLEQVNADPQPCR